MGRPTTPRIITAPPRHDAFAPADGSRDDVDWRQLPLDELEAIRLIDYEGRSQGEAAQRMGVSRQTVSRLLGQARKTVAAALLEGHGLRLEGGVVKPGQSRPPANPVHPSREAGPEPADEAS